MWRNGLIRLAHARSIGRSLYLAQLLEKLMADFVRIVLVVHVVSELIGSTAFAIVV
jgi:hypothetical protein